MVFMVFHGFSWFQIGFSCFFSKMYPPKLYTGPTIQSRSAARRAAMDIVIKNNLIIPKSLTIQSLQMEVWTLMVEKSWTLIFLSWMLLRIAINQFCNILMKLCFRMFNFIAIAIVYTWKWLIQSLTAVDEIRLMWLWLSKMLLDVVAVAKFEAEVWKGFWSWILMLLKGSYPARWER